MLAPTSQGPSLPFLMVSSPGAPSTPCSCSWCAEPLVLSEGGRREKDASEGQRVEGWGVQGEEESLGVGEQKTAGKLTRRPREGKLE